MRMLIKNIRIVSPGNGLDRTGSIVISDGTILRVGDCAETDGEFDTVIDGKGLVAAPGLVEVHVHFRGPRRCRCGKRRFHDGCLHGEYEAAGG